MSAQKRDRGVPALWTWLNTSWTRLWIGVDKLSASPSVGQGRLTLAFLQRFIFCRRCPFRGCSICARNTEAVLSNSHNRQIPYGCGWRFFE